MSRAWIQFTARKRQPWDGEPYRWRHGPYRDLAEAEGHAAAKRIELAREVRVEVILSGLRKPKESLGAATKAGMARARKAGATLGRPSRTFADRRAYDLLREGLSLREVAQRLKVPESTLRGAMKRRQGGCAEKGRVESSVTTPAGIACSGFRRIWCGTFKTGVPLLWDRSRLLSCEEREQPAKPVPKRAGAKRKR